jgi:hypothetical protein
VLRPPPRNPHAAVGVAEVPLPGDHLSAAPGPILVQVDRLDGWLTIYVVTTQEGEAVVSSVHVVAKPDTMKGRNDLVRWLRAESPSVPPGGLTERTFPGVEHALSAAADAVRELSPGYLRGLSEIERDDLDAYRREGGGPGHDDFFYARLAAAYVDASKSSRSPVADVAEELGYRRGYVRDILHRARERGFLTPPEPGRRAGGKLTDKAIATLARETS